MKILSGVITDYDGEIKLRGQTVRFGGTRDAEAAGDLGARGERHPVAGAHFWSSKAARTPASSFA